MDIDHSYSTARQGCVISLCVGAGRLVPTDLCLLLKYLIPVREWREILWPRWESRAYPFWDILAESGPCHDRETFTM